MLRASFFSIGLFVAMWGGSFLLVDRIVFNVKSETVAKKDKDKKEDKDKEVRGMFTVSPDRKHVFDPPDWAAFTLISIGTVTMLYAAALPRRQWEHHH